MTAIEWLKEQFLKHELIFDPEIKNFEQHLFNEALEMEKQQSQDYAKFAIYCDRKDLPILNFEDYIKLQ
jgi:hypothetical protein